MKKDFSKEIIEKIKGDKIKPIKKWKINFKNNSYWAVLALMVLLSGAFFSLIILDFAFFGPETYGFFKFREFFHILIFAAPYLWIFALIVSVVSGILIFKQTKTGYRYSLLLITSIILLVVSILGVSAHFSRMNERFENGFLGEGPNQTMMKFKKEGRLFMPEEGILVGEIIEFVDENIFIKDPMQEDWTVEYSKKTKINPDVNLIIGEKIIIFGEKGEGNSFFAIDIKRLKRPEMGGPHNDKMLQERDENMDMMHLREDIN